LQGSSQRPSVHPWTRIIRKPQAARGAVDVAPDADQPVVGAADGSVRSLLTVASNWAISSAQLVHYVLNGCL